MLLKLWERYKPFPFRISTCSKTLPGDILLNVPNYQQTDWYSCGGIACLKILKYYGKNVSPQEVLEMVGCSGIRGSDDTQVLRTLDYFGLKMIPIHNEFDMDTLTYFINQKIPVLTGMYLKVLFGYIDHWDVIYGVNPKRNLVYFAANIGREQCVPFSDFRFDGAAWAVTK